MGGGLSVVTGGYDIYTGITTLQGDHDCKELYDQILIRIVRERVRRTIDDRLVALARNQNNSPSAEMQELSALEKSMRELRDDKLPFHTTTRGGAEVTGGVLGTAGGTTMIVGAVIGGPLTLTVGGVIGGVAGTANLVKTVAASVNDYTFRTAIWDTTAKLAKIAERESGPKVTFEVPHSSMSFYMLVQYQTADGETVRFMSCDAHCGWSGGTMQLESGIKNLVIQFRSRVGSPVYAVAWNVTNTPWKVDEHGKYVLETWEEIEPLNNLHVKFVLSTNFARNAWLDRVELV